MNAPPATRLKIAVRGAVQGVGFRPFVYRLANELGLAGWVNNSLQGVFLEVEGRRADAEQFLLRLETEKPPRSSIQSLESSWLDPAGYTYFEIRKSRNNGSRTAIVLPDIATCPDCLREIFDPANRRHLYPFTNCTNCGPRFSIIESLPYDRANTSMKEFAMCPECQAEYNNPDDRRFHAQPNACPKCGPHLEFWRSGVRQSAADPLYSGNQPRCAERGHEALVVAADAIRHGQIVALKGIGGFQLIVDARNEEAVLRLRERKQREEKPFALMFSSMESVKADCEVSSLEERLLRSPEAPIVLLRRLSTLNSQLSTAVAPRNPNLGVMLPCSPLHHLLMSEIGVHVVATSGNLSDEPICIDEREALERLAGIADVFLVHNRPIVRPVDDSVVRVMLDREMVLRRARGYAPLPIQIKNVGAEVTRLAPELKTKDSELKTQSEPPHVGACKSILAVGAHFKNAVALSVGPQIFVSQHIGDLETVQSYDAFVRVIGDFQRLYDSRPEVIAMDAHPDYLSTKFARDFVAQASLHAGSYGIPAASLGAELGCSANPQAGSRRYVSVQHHLAHVFACMAENDIEPPLLGVAWDGTGYGLDGTVWGGEFFHITETSSNRVAHFRQFRLPGGDKAVKDPRRSAIGLLYEIFAEGVFEKTDLAPVSAFSESELAALKAMLKGNVNSPLTSSVGRLFDAVAALTGLRQQIRFEGQAAMELEFALDGVGTEERYELPLVTRHSPPATLHPPLLLDWSPMIEAILADVKRGVPVAKISAKFHNALAEAIVAMAKRAGERRVVLSGGCFQNRYLTERTVVRLRQEGFQPYWHQRIPPNDGGIALGQIVAAMRGGE